MLIKALCEYADRLSEKSSSDTPPAGRARQDVSYRIMLSPDGDVTNIIDIREEISETDKKGKVRTKRVPTKILLPERTQKTAIDSNTIEHRPLYIFGLELGKDGFTVSGKAEKSHAAFVKHELEFFDGLDSEMCTAYRNFLEKWQPENETENPLLKELGNEYKNSYFSFGLSGGKAILEKDEQFIKKYDEFVSRKNAEKEDNNKDGLMQCGITGEFAPTARIHDKIKFPGGNSTGCVLVGMKESAFESYGKVQSYNSGISETAMKKYTSAFNYLLSDKHHRVILDDLVIVFFAIKESDINKDDTAECEMFLDFFGDTREASENKIEDGLKGALKTVKDGSVGDTEAVMKAAADEKVPFYAAGLTANSSRICQKFIYRGRFGDVAANLRKHQNDLNMGGSRPVSFYALSKQLVPPKSKDAKVPPPLMTGIILSALNGTKYPDAMLHTAVRRVLTDSDGENEHFTKLNDIRAGIIKACINRKYGKEELTVALNEKNNDEAYLCGRLFAVLEKIQQDASEGTLNRTITDSYFSSAASKPSSVLPKLVQLSLNHQRKLSEAGNVFYGKLIGSIIEKIDGGFPQTLDLDGQGRFIVGYYQQKQSLYTKNADK